MGRNKSSSKALEKKRDRLAMEKKMNERVQVAKAANLQADPMQALPSFRSFQKNGLGVSLTTERLTSLDESTKSWLMDLITRNMKKMYEACSWGWSDANKRDEMFDESAWYLVAREEEKEGGKKKPVAFAHFRFDMDFDDEVLYVYEIQMEDSCRRKGLGRFMMQILELLAFKADMRKIMLTVLKHNDAAVKFFKDNLRFEIDETCPIDDVYEQFDYEILSKFNKRKLAKEEAETASVGGVVSAANGNGHCCAKC